MDVHTQTETSIPGVAVPPEITSPGELDTAGQGEGVGGLCFKSF